MKVKQHYDIAIVGMGPAGAVAVSLLGQQGGQVLVTDKSCSLFDKPRAVGMDHEIMRALKASAWQPRSRR